MRIGLWRKPLQDPDESGEDHENPNCPSPADGFDNITTDNRSEDRSNKGTDQENCHTDDMLETRVPNLQVR